MIGFHKNLLPVCCCTGEFGTMAKAIKMTRNGTINAKVSPRICVHFSTEASLDICPIFFSLTTARRSNHYYSSRNILR
jgi:hypothetical protein